MPNLPQTHNTPLPLLRPEGAVLILRTRLEQVYSYEDENGREYHWSITAALAFAHDRNELHTISLQESGLTLPLLRRQYPGLDEEYALTRDLSIPLLFVPVGEPAEGKVRLIDGWHRVARALLTGVDVLPAYFLTQEEADQCLIAINKPEQAVNDNGVQTKPPPRAAAQQMTAGETRP